jgi:hypothetical protein
MSGSNSFVAQSWDQMISGFGLMRTPLRGEGLGQPLAGELMASAGPDAKPHGTKMWGAPFCKLVSL